MMSAIIFIHVLVAIAMIGLVLVQDAKGGAALGIGGGSNSVLGATGAQSLAGKATMIVAIVFGLTNIWLAREVVVSRKSVIDSMPIPAATAPMNAPTATTEPAADSATANSAAEGAANAKDMAPGKEGTSPVEEAAPTADQ